MIRRPSRTRNFEVTESSPVVGIFWRIHTSDYCSSIFLKAPLVYTLMEPSNVVPPVTLQLAPAKTMRCPRRGLSSSGSTLQWRRLTFTVPSMFLGSGQLKRTCIGGPMTLIENPLTTFRTELRHPAFSDVGSGLEGPRASHEHKRHRPRRCRIEPKR